MSGRVPAETSAWIGALQVPRRLVVDVLAAQSQVEELQCHGAESSVVSPSFLLFTN